MSTIAAKPIRARIRDAIGGVESPSSGAVARAVLEELPESEYRAALDAALPYLAADEIRKYRHAAIGEPHPRETEDHAAARMDDDLPPPATVSQETTVARRAAGRKGFDRAQQRRERDSALLRTPVAISRGKHKALGDCTVQDLRDMARFQRARAAENEVRADAWEKLATRLEEQGVGKVRELDAGAVREAVGRR